MVVVSEMLADIIADNLLTQRKRMNVTIIAGWGIFALSFSFFILGTGLCIYASHLWFATHYSDFQAVYFTGAISFFIAFAIALFAVMGMRYRRHRIKKIHNDILDKVQEITKFVDQEFGTSIRENPKLSLLIATVSGFITQDLRR